MGFVDPLFEIEAGLAARGGPSAVVGAAGQLLALFEQKLEAERDRLALWLVAGLGAGILVYFALPDEPPLGWGLVLLAGAGLLAVYARGGRLVLEAGALLIAALALGFLAAEIRTRMIAAPVLAGETRPVRVEGTLLSVDAGGRGMVKALFAVRGIADLPPEKWPRRIRVSLRPGAVPLLSGADYAVKTALKPPQGPAAPGAYDFAQRAFFEQVGATGFSLTPPELLPGPPGGGMETAIERVREELAARISARLQGAASGVAVALVTGLRTDIPKPAENDLRNSGLYHLISISGVHMSAIALGLFVSLRLMLALVPGLALRFPIKKWAAGLAILGTFLYLLFTGSSVPTVRSFVMVALVFLAVIADRRALTMRNVALAAALILLVLPESVLDPGFQMSFAATAALIALYESWDRHWIENIGFGRFGPYMLALVLSGVVAGFATTPFSVFHFQTATPFGVISNLLAVPVTDLIIMPAAFLVYFLAPLGWDAPVIWVLGQGCALILWIARVVGGLPGAVEGIAAGPPGALLLIVFGGLWLMLWRKAWRAYGALPIAAGMLLWGTAEGPDLLIDRQAAHIALRDGTGRLGLLRGRGGSYEAATWIKRDGLAPGEIARRAKGAHCDAMGCAAPLQAGGVLAVSDNPGSLGDDCARARILISTGVVRQPCAGPALIIDRRLLSKLGTIAVTIRADGIAIIPARGDAGRRPWSPPLAVPEHGIPAAAPALVSTAE